MRTRNLTRVYKILSSSAIQFPVCGLNGRRPE